MLLWGWNRAGLPLPAFNELLFFLSLALLLAALGRPLREALPPTVLFAVADFNYVNFHQLTAESLFVPLSLGLLVLLARYLRAPAFGTSLAVAACLAALLLTRYFALFFALPLALGCVLLPPARPRRRLARALTLAALALLPVSLWMARAWRETGYLTGADRSAPRRFPAELAYWSALSSFRGSLWLMPKTLLVDFLSPGKPAVLSVVTQPYAPQPIEYVEAALLLIAAVVAARAFWRSPAPRFAASSLACLSAAALALYLVATLAVWSVGNNDPLYTRFLWPAYPFVLILATAAYARVKEGRPSHWRLLPFRLLYAVVLVLQLSRSWAALPMPVRYDLGSEEDAPPTSGDLPSVRGTRS